MDNKFLIQSQILTCAKYDFSVYEKRIMYYIVKCAQAETEGLKFPKDCRPVQHNLWNQPEVIIPIKEILLDEADKHHSRIKAALKKISTKQIEYTDRKNKTWYLFNLFIGAKVDGNREIASLTINPTLWDMILDFSKGFTPYELKVAMSFSSVYSMRFYELLANNTHRLDFSVETLKKMFNVQKKYKLTSDVIRNIIEPAKKELDACSPYTFTYETYPKPKKADAKRLPKIEGFYFYPIYQPQFADENLETKNFKNRTCLSWDIPKNLKDYLINNCNFTQQGLKNNRDLFIDFQRYCSDCVGVLGVMKTAAIANGAKSLQGYLIKAIRNYIAQQQNQ